MITRSVTKRKNSAMQNYHHQTKHKSTEKIDKATVKGTHEDKLILSSKYHLLKEIFIAVELITSEKSRINFEELKSSVQEKCRRNIDELLLRKIEAVYPELHRCSIDRIRIPESNEEKNELIINRSSLMENRDDLISINKRMESIVIAIAEQREETKESEPSDSTTPMSTPDPLPAFQGDLENVPKTSLENVIGAPEHNQNMLTEESASSHGLIVQPPEFEKSSLMDTTIQKFAFVKKYPAYVDKSMLIKAVLKGPHNVLIVAPRRFGKSVNLDMLRCFFERCNEENQTKANLLLFENLLIKKEHSEIMECYGGKYPIIYMDFRPHQTIDSYAAAFSAIRYLVHKAYMDHHYLKHSEVIKANEKEDIIYIKQWCSKLKYESSAPEEIHVLEGLTSLVKYLQIHFSAPHVYVFIDEYDSICTNAVLNVKDTIDQTGKVIPASETIIKIINFCVGAIESLAKGNDNVERVILTGISFLMTQGLSNIGNVDVFRFQENHIYAEFYGLSSSEVMKLINDNSLNVEFEDIKKYYNGYSKETLNTLSVMKYLNSSKSPGGPQLCNYWKESGIIVNLNEALHVPCVKSVISQLSVNLSNEVEITKFKRLDYKDLLKLKAILDKSSSKILDADIFFNFLLEQGYFSVVKEKEGGKKVVVRIPNREIIDEFQEKFKKFYEDNYKLDMCLVEKCANVFDRISASDEINETNFREISCLLNKILNSFVFPSHNEATFHYVIFIILFFCEKFDCFSEVKASKDNRNVLDLCLLNFEEQLGIIIELKCKKDSDVALEQIFVKKYYDAFKNEKYNPNKIDIKYKIFVGIDMSSDQKVTMSLLLNDTDMSKKITFPK